MLRDTLAGLIEPMLRGAGVHCSRASFSPRWIRHRTIDPQCLENPRPAGAESTLTENARSPFHAEPRQKVLPVRIPLEILSCWRMQWQMKPAGDLARAKRIP